MKGIIILIALFALNSIACDYRYYDVVVVGDSQTGAFWAKSYFGNFLANCIEGEFKIYGRGGHDLCIG